MTIRSQRVLDHLRRLTKVEDLFHRGVSHADVKAALINLFRPYSENLPAIEVRVIDFLVGDAVNLFRVIQSPTATSRLEEALRIHRASLRRNRAASLAATADHLPAVNDALSKYWSLYHLQQDLRELELEEYVHECLQLLGGHIEGAMKPLLYELAHQVRIERGVTPTLREINAMSLGNAIEVLVQVAPLADHYSSQGVRLSQWRNIAQHLDVKVEGDVIKCAYGAAASRAELRLDRKGLRAVVDEVVLCYLALKTAHSINFFERIDELEASGNLARVRSQISLRAEVYVTHLTAAVATQGFEVLELDFSSEESRLVVRDVTTDDLRSRCAHAMQFVISLYQTRPTEKATVEYRDSTGAAHMRISASKSLFERAERENNIHRVMDEADLVLLSKAADTAR